MQTYNGVKRLMAEKMKELERDPRTRPEVLEKARKYERTIQYNRCFLILRKEESFEILRFLGYPEFSIEAVFVHLLQEQLSVPRDW